MHLHTSGALLRTKVCATRHGTYHLEQYIGPQAYKRNPSSKAAIAASNSCTPQTPSESCLLSDSVVRIKDPWRSFGEVGTSCCSWRRKYIYISLKQQTEKITVPNVFEAEALLRHVELSSAPFLLACFFSHHHGYGFERHATRLLYCTDRYPTRGFPVDRRQGWGARSKSAYLGRYGRVDEVYRTHGVSKAPQTEVVLCHSSLFSPARCLQDGQEQGHRAQHSCESKKYHGIQDRLYKLGCCSFRSGPRVKGDRHGRRVCRSGLARLNMGPKGSCRKLLCTFFPAKSSTFLPDFCALIPL